MKKIIILSILVFQFILLFSQDVEELSTDSLFYGRKRIIENIYKPIINHILVKEKTNYDSTFNYQQVNYDYFLQYESYQIKNIYLVILDPFEDPVQLNDKSLIQKTKELSNRIHINTKESVIFNHLLFKKGDQIDAFLFSESERAIRQNQYIFDAGIMIDPDEENIGQANVFIYVHDLWSIQITGNYDNKQNKGVIRYKDINFLGYGGSLSLKIKKDPEYYNLYKPDFEYKYSKLLDKYNVGRLYYESDLNKINYGFGINKISLQKSNKILGGFNVDFFKHHIEPIEPTQIIENRELFYREQDYWIGYNYTRDNQKKKYNKFNNIILSTRLIQQFYHKKPSDNIYYYQDNVFLMAGLSIINKYYYQDAYIFGFGKTEDIPVGQKLEFIIGKEFQKNENRDYFGISGTISRYHRQYGYMLNNIKFGTFIEDNQFDYGIFDIQTLYFCQLYFAGSYKIRHYINVRYSKVINPYDQNQLISIRDNIRGYPLNSYLGDKRLILNIEHDLYTPYTVIGFKTAFVLFTDFGLIAENSKALFSSSLKSGLGIGFRFKNEKLIIPTIQISFAYYNDSELLQSNDSRFFKEERTFYQFSNIDFEKPRIYGW